MNLWSKPGLGQRTPKSCGSFPKLGVPFGGPLQKDYSSYFGVFVGVACCADLVNKPKDAQPVLSSEIVAEASEQPSKMHARPWVR